MAHGVIRMEAIEIEEIDRSIPEMQQRLVECVPQQHRKGSVTLIMKGTKVLIDGLIVTRRLRIARPGIDGKAVLPSCSRRTAWQNAV
jgi:hypothetical protein